MITTPKDIQAIRPVAINVADEAITPFIEDVEKQDVLPVIGVELYFEIEADKDNPEYNDLLFGGTYATSCGTGYTRGLVAAVAYLAYARMLIFGDIQYTAFGTVLKNTQFSQRPGEVDKIRAADSAKKIGMSILHTVAELIKVKHDKRCCGPERVSRPRFISISKKTL